MRVLIIIIAVVLLSCEDQSYTTLGGKTMGTYYNIQYRSDKNYQPQIDSLLSSFISAASTYDSTSELSFFNRNGLLRYNSPHLLKMLTLARQLHSETSGAFEPTLMPLIRAHGFSTSKRQALTKEQIDSLLSFVSFDYVAFDRNEMRAMKRGVQLDLNAMGEGYAIDMIADFLLHQNVRHFKVEIGGEMKCQGRNPQGEVWTIGIEDPSTPGRLLTTTLLDREAISTSGTSRKFFRDATGQKRSHIVNPKTGYSIENNLLSVTVKDPQAVRADVLATALMVMGLDSAKRFIGKFRIDAWIVYEENGKVLSWHTPGFSKTQDRSVARR